MVQQLELEQEERTVARVSQRNEQATHRGDTHYLQM